MDEVNGDILPDNKIKSTSVRCGSDYGLSNITSPRNPIYQQLLEFYNFSSHVRGFTDKTMQTKVNSVNNFVKFSQVKRVEDITNQHIYDWIDWHKTHGNTGRTINIYIYQLRTMLKWQRDENIQIPGLKLSRIAMQKEEPARKNWFTRKQIQVATLYADPKVWLMIMISFECGLRIEELVNLKLSDIHGKKLKIVGKGRKLRWVMMSCRTKRRLKRWIKRTGVTGYVWEGRAGNGHITQEDARKAMEKVFAMAGFNNFRPHDLRHSFATELKLLGLPTRKIQLALGHTSEAITEHYLSDLDGITIEDIQREVRFSLVRAKFRAFVANVFYVLPRLTLKGSDR